MSEGSLPATIREIPDSWWELIIGTGQWYISPKDFGIPNVDLADLRNFFYRRCQSRSMRVATKISKRDGRLYLQARKEHFYIDGPRWDAVRPVPPLPTLRVHRDMTDRYAALGEAMVSLFRSHGFPVGVPDLPRVLESELPEPEVMPFEKPVLPPPPGWSRSQYTGELLPPGALDVKGATYEDGMSKKDIVDMSYEFAEIAKKCSCGTADLRHHEPSCQAWIS